MVRILFGIILGILLFPVALLVWMNYGKVPVAVSDPPLPFERQITHTILDNRIDKEVVHLTPFPPDPANLIAGAHIYTQNCAFCHGLPGRPSEAGDGMYPGAPRLWQKHSNSNVVGVSDDPPGETFWKIKNGIRLSGMPSYKSTLSEEQMWQVALLLSNADKPLPADAQSVLQSTSVLLPGESPISGSRH